MDFEHLQRLTSNYSSFCMLNGKKVGFVVAGIFIAMATYMFLTSAVRQQSSACESTKNELMTTTSDICPWQFVMSDLTHRLRLLEMAFKEHVLAREVIAAEVTNQTYSNLELEKRLENFTVKLTQMSLKLDKMSEQVMDLSSRLYSDECLGFLVLVFVAGQVILTLRAKLHIKHTFDFLHQSRQGSRDLTNQNCSSSSLFNKNNDNTGSLLPVKQSISFSKQDICIIGLDKSAWKLNADVAEVIVRCVTDDTHAPLKYYYVIDSSDTLLNSPRARLFIILFDFCCSHQSLIFNGNENTQHCGLVTTLKHLRSIGGHIILVIINELDSQTLPSHCLYNTKLTLIQETETIQELASNGRVLSLWKELSHSQLGHIRKIARSLLSFKGK